MKNFIFQTVLPQIFKKSLLQPALFWLFSMIANIFNWLYNLQAGRMLSREEFAILTVFLSFQYLLNVPANALATTVGRFTAYYSEKGEQQKFMYFFRQYWWLSWGAGIFFIAFFLLLKGTIENFFHIDLPLLLLLFTPISIPLFLFAFERGMLSGQLAFFWVGILYMVEAGIKFIFLNISYFNFLPYLTVAVISLPVSCALAWFISTLVARSFHPLSTKLETSSTLEINETYKFLSNSFLVSFGAVLIYNIDVLLVKHFFSDYEAGVYATLSLLGKMLFFGAGSLISVLIPLTARANAKGTFDRKPFLILTSIVTFVGGAIWLSYTLAPQFVVTTLLAEQALVTLPYLSKYSLGMLFLVIASCFTTYNLAKKNYLPANIIMLAAFAQGILIYLFHSSLDQVVTVILFTLLTTLILIAVVDFLDITPRAFIVNWLSFLKLFNKDSFVTSNGHRRLRVLIFNWKDIKHVKSGGAEVYIHEVSKRLARKGYEVTIFTSNDGKCESFEIIDNVKVVRRGGFLTVYFWAVIYYLFKFHGRFDVIIDSENGIPFFSPLYSSKPVILLVHHVHQDIFFRSLVPPFSWIANFIETYFMPQIYKNSSVVAVSPSTAEDLMKEVGIKTSWIIPNGVDTKVYTIGEKSKIPLISYVGRIKQYKSIEILILSFDKILREFPDAKLLIAGEGDYRPVLEKIVKDLKLSSSIRFLGRVSERKKIKLLQRSWIMVHPSYLEGWGITCLEANACGTVVLASNVAGLKDVVSEGINGYLFEYGNSFDLYQKIKDLLLDQSKRNQMSIKARVWSSQFSWDETAKKFDRFIIQILAGTLPSSKLHLPSYSKNFTKEHIFVKTIADRE